jgi:large subunit ribosomal protein L31
VTRARARRPGDHIERKYAVKKGIHPEYVDTTVTCSCGNTFQTRSTATSGTIHAESCSECHPFYTGKQRVLDTAGRVAKFQQKYAKAKSGK